jgi:hypothetical protein
MRYETIPHSPTSAERALIDKLLSADFRGRDALRIQAATAQVHWVLGTGAPALLIEPATDVPFANVAGRVPVEATGHDIDGMIIHFLLHVVDKRVREVEIYREDGDSLQRMPDIRTLTLEVNLP